MSRIEGSATYAALLEDPEVIEIMASQPKPKPSPPPLFRWTKEIAMQANIIDQQIATRASGSGRDPSFMPRPKIPGWEVRQKKQNSRLLDNIAKAQARAT